MSMTGTRPPRRPWIACLLGGVAAAALSVAALPEVAAAHDPMVAVAATSTTVTIARHSFGPAALTIVAGTTVTWKNADDTPHTVRGRNQDFASGALDAGDSFSHTFTTPGDYTYFCSLHPFMVGEIIVKPAGKSS